MGNEILDHSDVVGALAVGTAPTTSPFKWLHCIGQTQLHDHTRTFKFGDWVRLIIEI